MEDPSEQRLERLSEMHECLSYCSLPLRPPEKGGHRVSSNRPSKETPGHFSGLQAWGIRSPPLTSVKGRNTAGHRPPPAPHHTSAEAQPHTQTYMFLAGHARDVGKRASGGTGHGVTCKDICMAGYQSPGKWELTDTRVLSSMWC